MSMDKLPTEIPKILTAIREATGREPGWMLIVFDPRDGQGVRIGNQGPTSQTREPNETRRPSQPRNPLAPASDKQIWKIRYMIRDANISDDVVIDRLRDEYHVSKLKDLNMSQTSDMIDWLKRMSAS